LDKGEPSPDGINPNVVVSNTVNSESSEALLWLEVDFSGTLDECSEFVRILIEESKSHIIFNLT
jgi:hypothetical protein